MTNIDKQHFQCDQCLLVKWSWAEPGTCNICNARYGKENASEISEMPGTSEYVNVCQCNVFQSVSICFNLFRCFKMLQMLQAFKRPGCLAAWQYLRQGKGRKRQQLVLPGFRTVSTYVTEPWVQWVYLTKCHSIHWQSEKPLPLQPNNAYASQDFWREATVSIEDSARFAAVTVTAPTSPASFQGGGHEKMMESCTWSIKISLYVYIYIYYYIFNYIYIATRSSLCLLPWNALRDLGRPLPRAPKDNWHKLISAECMDGSAL